METVVGTGLDLVEVSRLRRAVERRGERLLRRLFTPSELAYCGEGPHRHRRLAARFAAKEAVLKALGTGLRRARWSEVEVVHDRLGRPGIELHGLARRLAAERGVARVVITLTHTGRYAAAHALALGGP